MKITLIKPRIGRGEIDLYIDEGRMEPLQLAVLAGMTPEDVELEMFDDRMEDINFDEEDALDRVLNEAVKELSKVRMRFPNESDYVIVNEFKRDNFELIEEFEYDFYGKYRGEFVMLNKEDYNNTIL